MTETPKAHTEPSQHDDRQTGLPIRIFNFNNRPLSLPS